MSRYTAYPRYKDSGIEWVGEIPKSLKVNPLFSVASTGIEKTTTALKAMCCRSVTEESFQGTLRTIMGFYPSPSIPIKTSIREASFFG